MTILKWIGILVISTAAFAGTQVEDVAISYKLREYEKALSRPKAKPSGAPKQNFQRRNNSSTQTQSARRFRRDFRDDPYRFRGRRGFRRRYRPYWRDRYFRDMQLMQLHTQAARSQPVQQTTPPRTFTQEELLYINSMLDQYESWQGNFQVTLGGGAGLGKSSDITHGELMFRFMPPPTYRDDGQHFSRWAFGAENRSLTDAEDDITLSYNQLYLETLQSRLGRETVGTVGFRLGIRTVSGVDLNSALLFGLNYGWYNLQSTYSYHIGYEGAYYNISSSDSHTVLESKIQTYFRVYYDAFHIDFGGDITFLDLESRNQYNQIFFRVGTRF